MKRRSLFLILTAITTPLMLGNARPVQADTVLAPGGNFSGVAGYTYIKVVNLGPKQETVTVSFRNDQGTELGSASAVLEPTEAWGVGTDSGPRSPDPCPRRPSRPATSTATSA